jgi:hypothetical protein
MSNKGIKVKKARRKNVRDLQSPFGKNFAKYIAEIVTNSDDSYKRLEEKNILDKEEIKEIAITVTKNKNGFNVSVRDNAEGLSKESIDRIFGYYGGDNAGGESVKSRGIFGQGASDVLFNSAYYKHKSQIISIKDDRMYKATFYLDENLDRFVDSKEITPTSKQRKQQLRESLDIKKNGTVVSFGVEPEIIKSNYNKLVKELENFYTFRNIFNSSNRKVTFKFCNKPLKILSSKEYTFSNEHIILEKKSFNFTYENHEINAQLTLYNNELKSYDNTRILVTDSNGVVYANDFFRFDQNRKARNISGLLIIPKLYSICKSKLNDEEDTVAILTENRDGFDSKTEFYKSLYESISPIMSRTIEEHGESIEQTEISNNSKFREALKKVNQYLKDEIDEVIPGGAKGGKTPPSDGLRFVRSEITITVDKTYSLGLLINSKMINPGDEITIRDRNIEYINIDKETLYFSSDDVNENNLVKKNIRITGKKVTKSPIEIKAKYSNYETIVLVNVIDDIIHYPENGLEFYPDNMRVKKNTSHKCALYFDTDYIPVGTRIIFVPGSNILLEYDNIEVTDSHIIAGNIGLINVPFISQNEECDTIVAAMANNLLSKLFIKIRKKAEDDFGSSGLIAGFRITEGDDFYQSYFDPTDKHICIVKDNKVNKSILGDLSNMNPKNPTFRKSQKTGLCDILSEEISILLVDIMIDKGKISIDYDGQQEYIQHIKEKKNEIFDLMFSIIDNN